MLSTASPRNPKGITKPSSLLLFVQPDEKFLEESAKVEAIYFLTIFGNKSMRKVCSQSKLALKLTTVNILNLSSIQVICITLRHAGCAKLQIMQKFFLKIHLHKNFRSKYCEQSETFRLKTQLNERSVFHRLSHIGMPYMGY